MGHSSRGVVETARRLRDRARRARDQVCVVCESRPLITCDYDYARLRAQYPISVVQSVSSRSSTFIVVNGGYHAERDVVSSLSVCVQV